MSMHSLAAAALAMTLAIAGCASERQVILDAGSGTADELQAQLELLQTIDQTPPVGGNRVTLLRDGGEAFPAMFAAMAAAKDSINLEYYTFDDVRSGGRALADILLDRLSDGVSVNVIYDAFGSNATAPEFLDRLRQAGAVLTAFNPNPLAHGHLDNPNDRDHRKIMVVDGRIAFVGGINLDHVYENPVMSGAVDDPARSYWRDTVARIEGPVVADLQRVFLDTWTHQKGVPLPPRNWFPAVAPTGNQTVRILASSPGDDQPLFYISLLRAMRAARHSIGMSTGYFVPTPQVREELVGAVRRGVQVRLLLPSRSDSADALAAGRAAYDDLLDAGIKIYEVQNAVLHSKFVVIDGVWLAIGSSNIDRRSVVFNNEVDAVVLGPRAVEGDTLLDKDVADAKEIDLKTWRSRPVSDRLHELRVKLWEFLL
jgi:cardiolipin synthase